MISKEPILTERIRKISGSFSWIDHRILSSGFLQAMTTHEIVLYFFLILVGDKNGMSFYHYDKICTLLKIDLEQYIKARNQLIHKSLIAFEQNRYQVLELPSQLKAENEQYVKRCKSSNFKALKDILHQMNKP
jgi:hypothetical protein